MEAFRRFMEIAVKMESVLAEEARMIRTGIDARRHAEIDDVKRALAAGFGKALSELRSDDHSLLGNIPEGDRREFADRLSALQTAMVQNEAALRRHRRKTARRPHDRSAGMAAEAALVRAA